MAMAAAAVALLLPSPSSSSSSPMLLLRCFCRVASFGFSPSKVRLIPRRRLLHFRPSSTLPSSSNASSSSLSLESLDAYYADRLEDQKKHRDRLPGRRRDGRRPVSASARKEEQPSFDSLPLSPLVKERLQKLNLLVPTDVQIAAIPVLLDGEDAAIQSYTGSGKTLAYLLPILSQVGPLRQLCPHDSPDSIASKRGGIGAVVVAPSRELAMQIVREAERILGTENKKTVQQLVGGANRSRQEEALRKNKPTIVVGTPGRISEISRDGKLHTHTCQFLVLDEADELLSIQYREDMRRILEHVGRRKSSDSRDTQKSETESEIKKANMIAKETKTQADRSERQTVLVSATMPSAVLRAAAEWGQKPVLVKGKTIVDMEMTSPSNPAQQTSMEDVRGVKESLPPSLHHFFAVSQPQHKVDTARKCIHAVGAQSAIVFMNHPRRLKDTVFKLEARGISAASLHGELSKLERSNTLTAFRNRKIRVLVTSEVGARGIDIPDCDLVVNLELPTDMTHYAHRAGRTGRLGRKGTVVSICGENESFVLKKFQRQLGIHIEQCEFVKGGLVSSKESKISQMPSLLKA